MVQLLSNTTITTEWSQDLITIYNEICGHIRTQSDYDNALSLSLSHYQSLPVNSPNAMSFLLVANSHTNMSPALTLKCTMCLDFDDTLTCRHARKR